MREPYYDDLDAIRVDTLNLSEGSVVLKGKTTGGKNYELTGDVEQVGIVTKKDEAYYYDFPDRNKLIGIPTDYYLKFKIKESANGVTEAYRVSLEAVDVERTARILASDRTAAALEAARVRVGAPEKAKIRYGDFMRNDGELRVLEVDEPHPIMVEFYWKEKVVK